MENQTSINLIKERSEMPEYIQPVQIQLRNFSLLALIITVIAGSATLVVYMMFQVWNQALTVQKNNYVRRLEELKPQETVYLTLKSRLSVVEKALSEGRSMAELIQNAVSVQPPPQLLSVSFSAGGEASMMVEAESLEEAIDITGKFISLYDQLKSRNPKLAAFSQDEEGISVTYSFEPLWSD